MSDRDNVLSADRYTPRYAIVVDGTSGDDDMSIGCTDADGDQIDGADGSNDLIENWDSNDTVFGGAGHDLAGVGVGDDVHDMGAGNDYMDDWDNAGHNTILGGEGFDTPAFENWQSWVGATVTFSGDGSGTFLHYYGSTTGSFSDFEAIVGTENADTEDVSAESIGMDIDGADGEDHLTGRSGDDTLSGGAGGSELLFRARHLCDMPGGVAGVMNGCRGVTHLHVLLEQHEVVFSNGIASESLYLGSLAYQCFDAAAQSGLATPSPELGCRRTAAVFGAPARAFLRRQSRPDHLGALGAAG